VTVAAAAATGTARGRGEALVDELDVCRVSRRCLALTGHVDDLLRTPGGAVLRLPETLALAATSDGGAAVLLDPAAGGRALTPPGARDRASGWTASPAPLSHLIPRALREAHVPRRQTLLVVTGAHRAAEDDELADLLQGMPLDPSRPHDVQIVAVFRTAVPPAWLADATGWSIHHIGLPDVDERQAALEHWHGRGLFDAASLDTAQLAVASGGLELDDLRRLVEEHKRRGPLDRGRVSALRNGALTRRLGSLLRVDHHPAVAFYDVAGGDAVRAAVRQAKRDRAYRPLGLWGPPGVGKTLIANAIARELGVPLIHVDGTLKGTFVGQTARNLALVREVVTAYAPVVLFLDEIDLLLGRTSDFNGDSGTSNEIRQAMLVLLQDAPRLGVQVVAASNNPWSQVQLRVRNRIRSIPIIHPTGNDVLAIADREAARAGVALEASARALFMDAEGLLWNGRDIERVISAGTEMARRREGGAGAEALSRQDLELLVRGLADGQQHIAELNALEAILVTDNPCDLPWTARDLEGRASAPLPAYLDGLVGPDGLPRRREIRQRLEREGLRDAR
jgi:hypothetical protein